MTLIRVATEFVLRLAELVEAEGRVARENLTRLAVAASIIAVGAGMMLITVVLFAAALFLALLRAGVYPELGLVILALIMGLGAVVCILLGRNMTGSAGGGRRP